MKFINAIAPSKEIRIKNNTQEWFDREVAELTHAREKLFLKFRHVNCFKHDIKKYFLKKLRDTEPDIYIVTLKEKTLRVSV